MPIPTTFEAFEVLGITDEVNACDCCGKAPLKSTVAIAFDDADPVFFGSTCAAKAAKVAPAVMAKAVRAAEKAKTDAAAAARREAARVEQQAWEAWLLERTGHANVFEAIQALGGFAEARKAFREDA